MKHSYVTEAQLAQMGADWRFKTRTAMLEYMNRDSLTCFICGKQFIALGCHVNVTHGISARQYKFAFNIPQTQGLLGKGTKDHLRELASQKDRVEDALALGQLYGPIYGPMHKGKDQNAPRYEDQPGVFKTKEPRDYNTVKPPVIDHSSLAPDEFERLQAHLKSMPLPKGYEQNSLVARVERLEKLAFRILRALEQFERKE
jgi:hypothetical protein